MDASDDSDSTIKAEGMTDATGLDALGDIPATEVMMLAEARVGNGDG